jgi:hypothetical protein
MNIDTYVLGQLTAYVLLALPVIALFVVYALVRKRMRHRKLQQPQNDGSEHISQFVTNHIPIRLTCGEPSMIPLGEDEELLCVFAQTTLFGARAVRNWVGRQGGASFRVGKGIYLRAGASAGTSESHDEMRPLDNGTLVVTDKRLMFVGRHRTVDTPLQKIINIETEHYPDWLRINVQGQQRTLCFLLKTELPMVYEYNGETYSAPLHATFAKVAIEQPIMFQRFPLYGAYHPIEEPAPIEPET